MFVVFVGDEDIVLEESVVSQLLQLLLFGVVRVPAFLYFSLEGSQDRVVLLLYLF